MSNLHMARSFTIGLAGFTSQACMSQLCGRVQQVCLDKPEELCLDRPEELTLLECT